MNIEYVVYFMLTVVVCTALTRPLIISMLNGNKNVRTDSKGLRMVKETVMDLDVMCIVAFIFGSSPALLKHQINDSPILFIYLGISTICLTIIWCFKVLKYNQDTAE